MKKYLNVKSTLVCLVLVAILAIISFLAIYTTPKNNYNEYAKKTTLFTMGDATMSLDEALFIAKNRQAYYEEYYYTHGTSFSWDIPVEQGKTYEDIILEESLLYAKQVFIFSEYAKANGITLNETETKTVTASVNSFLSSSSSKLIKVTNATEDLVTRVYTRTALHDKVCDQILAGKDLTINEEDARNCLVGIVEINPQYFDSPERIAQKIFDRVNQGEVIGGVASVYDANVEKINVNKDSEIIKEIKDFCLALKDGQCKMTEINGVYFVVYCYLEDDELVTANAKEVLLEEKKNSYLTEFLENIEKSTPASINDEAWATVNFDDPIYTKNDIVQSK